MASPPHVASIACPTCRWYVQCAEIERRYGAELDRNGDQYKLLRHEGTRPPSPLRRCANALFDRELESMRDQDVLEIGCGRASPFTPAIVRANRIRYVGIDTALPRRGIPLCERGTIASVVNLPIRALNRWVLSPSVNAYHRWKPGPRIYHVRGRFPHPSLRGRAFGVIYASNSIEHWHEDLPGSSTVAPISSPDEGIAASVDRYRADLATCHTLLAPGGRLIIDAPIHLHGNGLFFRGRLAEIERLFTDLPWSDLRFEHWRRDTGDLRRYLPVDVARAFTGTGEAVVNLWQLAVIARR